MVVRRSPWLLDAALLLVIACVSIATLKRPQLDMITVTPWAGFGTVLPRTAWAALKVWTFWGIAAAVIGALALRASRTLELTEAAMIGLGGVWIFAWIAGNLLGPIGLFRAPVIWALLAIGAYTVWRRPPRVEWRPATIGQQLMILAIALGMPTLLVLQLGSPVPPFMDIFATPAAVQRIITFGYYQPFSNDPYGYWDAASQLPGLEVFYALLGIGSHTPLGVLAETGAIVPMALFLILVTYRLGTAIGGDLVGGMATLFLYATMLFRVMAYMHGRSTAFVLVGMGLALFLDHRGDAVRLVAAALALATAVASHAIIGGLGMATAAGVVVLWLAGGEVVAALAAIALLAGATLVAGPTIFVALKLVVPYPVLPAIQLAGVAVIVWSARRLAARPTGDRGFWLAWPIALWAAYVLLWHPSPYFPKNHQMRFPTLVYGGGLGLLALVAADALRGFRGRGAPAPSRDRPLVGAAAIAIAAGIIVEQIAQRMDPFVSDPRMRTAVHDLVDKVDYWYPFVFVFPAACLAAMCYRRARHVAFAVVMLLLFVPWRDHIDKSLRPEDIADPNYHQHSITESWAYQLETGKRGYWGQTGDRRWAQSAAELALAQVIRDEVQAGRITMDTHITQISPKILLYADNVLFSVYTGVNADTYPHQHEFDPSIAGSRIRPTTELPEKLATRPPYVLIHKNPLPLPPDALRGYTKIFDRDEIQLYRDDALMVASR